MVEKGRLILDEPLSDWLEKAIDHAGITVIPLERDIISGACSLPGTFHSDPADQLIVATTRVKNIPLLTADGKIQSYEFVTLYKE
ncbi:type II toxin-antitoxin system VapC family toxin [Spirosoma rigui]|uniref:type II toxin-antitoxin system VapC family toxin n=1 Tax=Spirosoma rigui TaxID=564064 RepID=UPI00373FE001